MPVLVALLVIAGAIIIVSYLMGEGYPEGNEGPDDV